MFFHMLRYFHMNMLMLFALFDIKMIWFPFINANEAARSPAPLQQLWVLSEPAMWRSGRSAPLTGRGGMVPSRRREHARWWQEHQFHKRSTPSPLKVWRNHVRGWCTMKWNGRPIRGSGLSGVSAEMKVILYPERLMSEEKASQVLVKHGHRQTGGSAEADFRFGSERGEKSILNAKYP